MSKAEDGFREGRRIALVGIAVSACLAGTNIAVGLSANSTSVTATGVEFVGDVLASTMVFLGMLVGGRPADDNHPYGHGRIETVAAFVVGMVVTIGGIGIGYRSLQSVGTVHPPPGFAAPAALILAIVARAIISTVKFRVGSRIQSTSLVADAWNDAVDILSASAALTAVALAMWDPTRFLAADHYGGFAVGLVVVVTGVRVIRDASLDLMDTMPAPDLLQQFRDVARSVDGVVEIDKVFARRTGLRYHVDIHIQVDGNLTVARSHQIAGRVRSAARTQLPWVADVLVHIEPGPDTVESAPRQEVVR